MCASLWIAFNYLSLKIWQQHIVFTPIEDISCELLSIIYLWRSDNNGLDKQAAYIFVVNCFQLFIFEDLTTTPPFQYRTKAQLWIAFNYLSLKIWQQLSPNFLSPFCSCELLSIIYLWRSDNNNAIATKHRHQVVNCFQLFIFEDLTTTEFSQRIITQHIRSCSQNLKNPALRPDFLNSL